MLVGHIFDFAIILRSRRRDLRLRQRDLAKRAGVSRGFICDLEHGKPTVEFGKVLKVMEVMNVPMSIGWNEEAPAWAKPGIKRAQARERAYAEARPRSWRQKLRPLPKPPVDWGLEDRADAGDPAMAEARRYGLEPELLDARARIVRVIEARGRVVWGGTDSPPDPPRC